MDFTTTTKKSKQERRSHALWLVFIVLALAIALDLSSNQPLIPLALGLNNTPTGNYENVTVWTRVNITNSKPEFLGIRINDNVPGVNATLNAGGLRTIFCNSTVRDWNGMNGNITINGTLYANGTSSYIAADDNNTHYTNTSCFNVSGAFGQNGVYMNYTCAFDVYYYANVGTWNCTMNALDAKDGKNYSVLASNATYFSPLYALNVSDGIDYGEIAVGEYSNNTYANVTNFGNVNINISVQGYGAALNDGWAFICNNSVSSYNISIGNEAFGLNVTSNFTQKNALTGAIQNVTNLTMPKQNVSGVQVINTTTWQVFIPPSINPNGECTGNVVFIAKAG